MKLKRLRKKKWFMFISNKYVLILLIFGGWMLFLDGNSWLIHRELNEEVDKLQVNKEYYQKEITKDKTTIEKLNDSFELESYARQHYYMKRADEDIFIIHYDTVD